MRDIEKDLELCEAASKGPWKVKTNRHRNTDGTSWGWVEGPRENWCWSKSRNKSYEDAAFIAEAREALPYWLGEVKRLRELTDALGDEVLGANADLAKANIALRTENERLREALDEIANPVKHMRDEAERKGARLNGLAIQLANNAAFLRNIARDALEVRNG